MKFIKMHSHGCVLNRKIIDIKSVTNFPKLYETKLEFSFNITIIFIIFLRFWKKYWKINGYTR